jgi:hypothetical protein
MVNSLFSIQHSAFSISAALADITDETTKASWSWHPQLPIWALLPLFALAAAAAIYLYLAQQRIATQRVVVTLTILRSLLILLMFLVLLSPVRQFMHTSTNGGSLWLMLDQSGSMAQSDPQANPVEKLRWADAAGFLPPTFRTSSLDRPAVKLIALREDANYLQGLTAIPAEDKDARKNVDDLVKGLKRWNNQLTATIDGIEKDPLGKSDPGAAATIKPLRTAADAVANGIGKVDTRGKPEEAATDIAWKDVQLALTTAAGTLQSVADKNDKKLAADPAAAEALGKVAKMSRAKLAELVLTEKSKPGAGGFDEVFAKQNLKVLGFGDKTQVIIPEKGEAVNKTVDAALNKPVEPATDIASALRTVGDHVAQDEPASVVVVSDGRQNKSDGDLIENARRLAGRGMRIYTLALGTDEVAPDAAVESVDAPDWIFKDDTLKVSAMLTLDGLTNKNVTVDLCRSKAVGGQMHEEVVDTKSFSVDDKTTFKGINNQPRKLISFSEPSEKRPGPGLYDYSVVIHPVGDEKNLDNNRQTTRVSVKDHTLSALVIEDQPRWEYRYLVNFLGRDKRVKLQTLLLQPAQIAKVKPPTPVKASPDNDKVDAQLLPETQDEWYKFDLIVLGDIPAESLSKQNQQFIAKAVTDRGATLILLAGPLNMPGGWGVNKADYPLAELFPVEQNPDWTPQMLQNHLRFGWHPAIAPEGADSLLSQFGIDDESNARAWNLLRTDPDLAWYWHSDVTQAKGGANVIWMIADNEPRTEKKPDAAAGPNPQANEAGLLEAAHKRAALATMNMGNGKVMYLAGDATWRLRQVGGQNLHERFWGQVIRWVVGNDLPAGGQFVRFGSDKPRYIGGEAAVVTARLRDIHLAPLKDQSVKVVARVLPNSGAPSDPGAPTRVEAEMTEVPDAPGEYRAVLGNLPSGVVELSLTGGDVAGLMANDPTAAQKTLLIDVQNSLNLEQRNMNADHHTLAALAETGNGASFTGPYADLLAEQLPELDYKNTQIEQIGLFMDPEAKLTKYSHWVFLFLFVGILTAEWIIRKQGGLV